MASYYSQVEDAVKRNLQEIEHLEQELAGLRSVEKDTPRESYQRQVEQIERHMEQERARLEANRQLLYNYNKASSNIMKLGAVYDLREKEHDPQIRREMDEEIEARQREIADAMGNLTDDLAQEVRDSILKARREQELANLAGQIYDEMSDQANIGESADRTEQREQQKALEEQLMQETRNHGEGDLGEETPQETKDDQKTLEEQLMQDPRNLGEGDLGEETPQETKEENRQEEKQSKVSELEQEDKRNIRYDELIAQAQRDMEEAEQRRLAEIAEMQRIFEEERNLRINEGPFETEAELDAIDAHYLRLKQECEERLNKAIDDKRKAKSRVKANERKKHKYALDKEKARELNIPVEEYEKIRKAASKKEILDAVLEKKGMTDSDSANEETKEQTTEEIIRMVVDAINNGTAVAVDQNGAVINQEGLINMNGGINIVVIDTVNLNYGTNIPVKIEGARKTKMPEKAKEKVKVKVKSAPRKVPRTGEENKGQTPGPAPKDMPGVKVNQEDANINQRGGINQNGGINGVSTGDINANTGSKDKKPTRANPGTGPKVTPEQETGRITPPPGTTTEQETGRITPPPGTTPEQETGRITPPPGTTPEQETGRITPPPGTTPEQETGRITPPPGTTPEQETKPKKEPRGLITIIEGLTQDLELGAKDGKRYRASNIKVTEQFRNELSSGNYLYNIVHFVPAVVKLPFNLLRKASGKIMLSADAKDNIAELKKRIAELPEEDLMVIYKQYRGSRVVMEGFPTILNTLLDERVQQFALEKVARINAELEKRYQGAFSALKQIEGFDALINDPSVSDKDKQTYRARRASILSGQADNIKAIRQGYIDANEWLSGGAHGFQEDMKAHATGLSVVGKRFAVKHDLDPDLLRRQAQLERLEMSALASGDDERALRAFVETEKLYSKNTEISGSLFGKRSEGKKYYSPLASPLDYRDDPFIRDVFTTIAVTSAAIGTVKAFHQQAELERVAAQQQAAIQRNEQIIQGVRDTGRDIADKRGVMTEGMAAQNIQSTSTATGEIERGVLDSTGWGLGTSKYRTADNAGHAFYNNFYDSTQGSIDSIFNQLAAGTISKETAMEMMSQLSANTQQTLTNVTQECLDILRPYAQANPRFDLHGVEEAMTYMVQNPHAIADMNQAMVDVTAMGDALSQVQLQHVATLQSVPSNVLECFMAFAASSALANGVTEGVKNSPYGNSVTEMVDEYTRESDAKAAEKQSGQSK